MKPSSKSSYEFHIQRYSIDPVDTLGIEETSWENVHYDELCPRLGPSHTEGGILQFVPAHYSTASPCQQFKVSEVFHFYQKSRLYRGETLDEFIESLRKEYVLTAIKEKGTVTHHITLTPSTLPCKQHHTNNRKHDKKKADSIHLALANIQGLITRKKNKCEFVKEITKNNDCKHQIIVLTESWTNNYYEKEITKYFTDYNLLMADRIYDANKDDPEQIKTRGGTLILTSTDITITPQEPFSNGNCEVAIADLPTINTLLISMYRPSGKNFSLNKFTEAIAYIQKHLKDNADSLADKNILLMGDFNFPKKIVRWRESALGLVPEYTEGEDIQKKAFELLINLTEEHQLEQMVNIPTRGKNTLDLVFTNQPHLFGECSTTLIKPHSDHDLVNFVMDNPCTITTETEEEHQPASAPEISSFNFQDADENQLRKELKEVNWREVLKITTDEGVETLADRFITEVVRVTKQAKVPKYNDSSGRNRVSKRHQALLEKRKDIQMQMNHEHCTNEDYQHMLERIKGINIKIQGNHEEERERQEEKAIRSIKDDPKAFFRFANKNRKTKSKIGPLKSGDSYYSGPKEMARILSEQYRSVFSKPKDNYDDLNLAHHNIPRIKEIVLTKEMFIQAMQSIKISSAPGPDGAPAFLYHKFAEELAIPVMWIWKSSLNSGLMPETTLLAIITPILKTVDSSIPANYRPVSLTNHLTKIFERVLRKHITDHLEEHGLMNKTQHGFRERHSTITQLLNYMDSILSTLEDGNPVDAIYLDFSKAFDKVDHHILLKKVESLGIQGRLLGWIKAFLTNRQQQVRVGDFLSPKEWLRSGVPQGSVLGPLLFLIMMVDIDKDVKHSSLASYADDTRLWRFICSAVDQLLLQEDLCALYAWAVRNNMAFNDDKFEHMAFMYLLGQHDYRSYKSHSSNTIRRKDIIKDLGAYISSNLLFDEHISTYVKATQQIAAWTLRTFHTREKKVLKVLLKSLIIPKIEYASVVWSPFDNKNINLIENIQRRYTSRILEYQTWDEERQTYACTTNYWDRLKDLKIYSLQRRRERFMILYMYRVIIGLLKFDWFDAYYERGIKIRPKYRRNAPLNIRRVRHSSFFYKGPQLYNLLPSEMRQIEDIAEPAQQHVDKFKKKLDDFLERIPDQPTVSGLHRAAATNSLICQIPFYLRQQRDAMGT